MRKIIFVLMGVVGLCLLIATIQRNRLVAQLQLPSRSNTRIVNEKPILKAVALAAKAEETKVPEVVKKILETAIVDTRKQETVREQVQLDPHVTPAAILLGGQRIGEVTEQEAKHPELKVEFQKFYLDCARDQETITVNRVQCLQRYLLSRGLVGKEAQDIVESMPEPVQKIYLRFTRSG